MNKNTFLIAVSWAAVVACAGTIFWFSAQKATESSETSGWLLFLLKLPVSETFIRKAAHFLEFAGLGVLIFNAIYQTFGHWKPFVSFGITSAYAVCDEIHQLFVEGRACRIFDWFIDSLGAAAGIFFLLGLIVIYLKIKGRNPK